MTSECFDNRLQDARDAFARHDWATARALFATSRELADLQAEDLFALADSAWWLGQVDESLTAYKDAYRQYVDRDRPRSAAVAAMMIAYTLALRGEEAAASAWFSRATRLLHDDVECVEHGYLVYLEAENLLAGGEYDAVIARAQQLQDMGRRFTDPNLSALGVMSEGLALVKQGRVRDGMDLLDEAMLSALSDDLDPAWAGNIYCYLMVMCHELEDIRRAGEWTSATARWCENLTATGPFLGICRVHRAHILQIQGDWAVAERDAANVVSTMKHFDVGSVAEAYYQIGELQRLRGDFAEASESYQHAHRFGRDPQPGLARLLLAEGRTAAARTAIRTALATEERDRLGRARLLAAQAEIALVAGDVSSAAEAGAELDETAATFQSSGLVASALSVRGAILLASSETLEAMKALRKACTHWQELAAPYETARVRVNLGRAYTMLGDTHAADREYDEAARIFSDLGSVPDLTALERLRHPVSAPGGLTEREVEVLTLVAGGKTNREIADHLFISPKTVARHVENIFAKLAVSSRTAAAAWAIDHDIAERPPG